MFFLWMAQDAKLLALLDVVIDTYITKWEPIGSKFLNTLEDVDYAPSTLRKYLHVLEEQGMVYQPYNSSGRIPTLQWLTLYLENCLAQQEMAVESEVNTARVSMKTLVETLGAVVDWVVVGFLKNDEYYYLGINNLLKEEFMDQYQATKQLISFVEEKRIVKFIDSKMLKTNQMYYTFIEDQELVISCLYAKVQMDGYDGVIAIIGLTRVDYKRNVSIMRKLLSTLN